MLSNGVMATASRSRPFTWADDDRSDPPPLHDAREALEFWLHRRDTLPLRRVRARREARAMALRWEERVRRAEIAEGARSLWGQLLDAFGVRPPSRATLPAPRAFVLAVGSGLVALGVVLVLLTVLLAAVTYEVLTHLP